LIIFHIPLYTYFLLSVYSNMNAQTRGNKWYWLVDVPFIFSI
jgi:hypothetical protein